MKRKIISLICSILILMAMTLFIGCGGSSGGGGSSAGIIGSGE